MRKTLLNAYILVLGIERMVCLSLSLPCSVDGVSEIILSLCKHSSDTDCAWRRTKVVVFALEACRFPFVFLSRLLFFLNDCLIKLIYIQSTKHHLSIFSLLSLSLSQTGSLLLMNAHVRGRRDNLLRKLNMRVSPSMGDARHMNAAQRQSSRNIDVCDQSLISRASQNASMIRLEN